MLSTCLQYYLFIHVSFYDKTPFATLFIKLLGGWQRPFYLAGTHNIILWCYICVSYFVWIMYTFRKYIYYTRIKTNNAFWWKAPYWDNVKVNLDFCTWFDVAPISLVVAGTDTHWILRDISVTCPPVETVTHVTFIYKPVCVYVTWTGNSQYVFARACVRACMRVCVCVCVCACVRALNVWVWW